MNSRPRVPGGFVSAIFSYELLDDGLDYETIERIHRGEFEDWISALTGSGLFTNEEIRSIEQQWRENPRLFLDALLAEADEVTTRRCTATWAALERLAPGMPIEVFA